MINLKSKALQFAEDYYIDSISAAIHIATHELDDMIAQSALDTTEADLDAAYASALEYFYNDRFKATEVSPEAAPEVSE